MKAVLNSFFFEDYRGSDSWPDDPKDFCVIVDLLIADKTMEGGDIFGLTVCSPMWFQNNVIRPSKTHGSHDRRSHAVFGRHYLFVDEFVEHEIERAIRELILSIEGRNWEEIALKLSRYFSWEFEDYKEFS